MFVNRHVCGNLPGWENRQLAPAGIQGTGRPVKVSLQLTNGNNRMSGQNDKNVADGLDGGAGPLEVPSNCEPSQTRYNSLSEQKAKSTET
jgi:hypothetical protein